jgi:hypothetical protein
MDGMMHVRHVFVREAALLLAQLAEKAAVDGDFSRVLKGEAAVDGWSEGPAAFRLPQPERATGFPIHAVLADGPERAAAPLGLAAYAARAAERVVLEGPVAALSLRI